MTMCKQHAFRFWLFRLHLFHISCSTLYISYFVSAKKWWEWCALVNAVSGVFLFCWVPFFTINISNAICIRYVLFEVSAICRIDPILFSLLTWLGYVNSFLNPVIYTIFNNDFRRVIFKTLLCRWRRTTWLDTGSVIIRGEYWSRPTLRASTQGIDGRVPQYPSIHGVMRNENEWKMN